MSQSVLVHPGSLQECLPGASWTLPGSQKTVVSSMQRFLEDSDSFVVSLKLFQGVLECFGSLQKRPKASWSAPEVSRNVSEHLLAGSWHPSRCPKASQSVRPGLCQWPPRDPGRVWKGSTTDPNAQMSAHSSPVKRPRASQKSPRMSQNTLQRPGTLQMSQSVLECLTWPLPMASKISGMCLGRLYNGPECPNVCTWLASRVLLIPPCFRKSLSKSLRSRASPMA